MLSTADSSTTDALSMSGTLTKPLWILAGQLGLVVAVFFGFGAAGDLAPSPRLWAVMLLSCTIATIALGPVRRINTMVIGAPVLAVAGWWMASFLWSADDYGWRRDTQTFIPLLVGVVVIAGLLPTAAFQRGLVAGCYVAILYTLYRLVADPFTAMGNLDDVPGWRGGFIHKNAMAPFMLFAALVFACFERSGLRRNLALATAGALVVMAQSRTSLAAGLVVLAVCLFLWRHSVATVSSRATLGLAAMSTALVGGLVAASSFPSLLELAGKDATLTSRTDIWDGVWRAILERPWLGYGPGGVWVDLAAEPARSILRDLGFVVYHSHNGFLEVTLQLGLIGLGIVIWLMVSTLRLGLGSLRVQPDLAVFTAGFVLLITLLSITEVATFGIWLVILSATNGVLSRTRRIGDRTRQHPEPSRSSAGA
jgi:exopolysaccharide production protein ExoQ